MKNRIESLIPADPMDVPPEVAEMAAKSCDMAAQELAEKIKGKSARQIKPIVRGYLMVPVICSHLLGQELARQDALIEKLKGGS
jgi:hypothetical protein